jgi:hypothetical protein
LQVWFFVVVLVSVGFVLYFAVHAVLHVNVRASNSLTCVTVVVAGILVVGKRPHIHEY